MLPLAHAVGPDADATPVIAARTGQRWWRDSLRRRLLAGADLLAVVLASALVLSGDATRLWALAFLPAWLLMTKLLGLYDRDHRAIRHLTIDEVPAIFASALGSFSLVGFLTLTAGEGLTTPRRSCTRWSASASSSSRCSSSATTPA